MTKEEIVAELKDRVYPKEGVEQRIASVESSLKDIYDCHGGVVYSQPQLKLVEPRVVLPKRLLVNLFLYHGAELLVGELFFIETKREADSLTKTAEGEKGHFVSLVYDLDSSSSLERREPVRDEEESSRSERIPWERE